MVARTLRPIVEWKSEGPAYALWEIVVMSQGANTIRGTARGRRFAMGEDLQPGRTYEVRVRALPVPDRPAGRWSNPGRLSLRDPPPEPRSIQPLTRTPDEDETSPAPSPDGESLAYRLRPASGGARAVVRRLLRDARGVLALGEPWRVDGEFAGPPCWVAAGPDGGPSLAFSSSSESTGDGTPAASIFRQEMSGSPRLRLGPPGISAPLGRVSTAGGAAVRVYFEGPEGGEIWSSHLDGSGLVLVAEGTEPQVSPDGRLLAFVSDRGGVPDLWLMRIGGEGSSKPLLRHSNPNARIESPAWSAGADSIAFAADFPPPDDPRAGNFDIHVLEIESGLVSAVTRSLADDRDPAFLPDGDGGTIGIVFASKRTNGRFDLFIAR